jgi:hypothetical protein
MYYAYFHSTVSYSGQNSTDSTKIFKMQKRAIRIITGSKNRDSCRDLFHNLKISQFHSQYILSLLLVVVDNNSIYNLNSDIHNIYMGKIFNFHQPSANLSICIKRIHSLAIKMFNSLHQQQQFNTSLKHYLRSHSYSIGEYLR